jgi:hypothetical protein
MRNTFLVLVAASVLCAACSSDESSSPRFALDTTVPVESAVTALVEAAEQQADRGTRSASASAFQVGDLGAIPPSATPGFDPNAVQAGGRTSFSFDADADGAAENVDVFEGLAGIVFVAWREAETCHLVADAVSARWYFRGTCGADGALVCRYVPTLTCELCDGNNCAACEASETVPGRVRCSEIVAPAPDVVDDTTAPDAGEDVVDTGSPDGGEVEDTGGEVPDVAPDVAPDTGPTFGECSAECMSFPGAVCCTECGCSPGSGVCEPVCPEGSYWDCEADCCLGEADLQCVSG